MNKKIQVSLFCFLIILLQGCMIVPQGYTPSTSLLKHKNIAASSKYDVTFSVEYISDGDQSIGRASNVQIIEIIKEKLIDSNAFTQVSYVDLAGKSKYHIHFIVHYSMVSAGESAKHGLLIGYTFCTIPTWQSMPIDISAKIYLKDKVIHSIATAEVLRCYIWLPLLPVCLVWNNWWAWTTQEKKCVNYIVNDLTNFQKKDLPMVINLKTSQDLINTTKKKKVAQVTAK